MLFTSFPRELSVHETLRMGIPQRFLEKSQGAPGSFRASREQGDKEHLDCVFVFTKHKRDHILKRVHTNKTNLSIMQIMDIDKQYSIHLIDPAPSEKGLFYINKFARKTGI